MKAKMLKKAKRGDILTGKVGRGGILRVWPFSSGDFTGLPFGIAARDIKKGELIKFDPLLNTKDIVRQGTALFQAPNKKKYNPTPLGMEQL